MTEMLLEARAEALKGTLLKHALIKEGSGEGLFAHIDSVANPRQREELFQPLKFPTAKNPNPTESTGVGASKFAPAEVASVSFLRDEASTTARLFNSRRESYLLLTQIFPDTEWYADAIGGVAQFGDHLSDAAALRDRLNRGDVLDENPESIDARFAKGLRADGKKIGEHTVDAIVDHLGKEIDGSVEKYTVGATTPEEAEDRIASRKYGIGLAAALYTEAHGIASDLLSSS